MSFTLRAQAELDQLPPKQREVLEQLAAFLQANGYAPSIQQLCDRCGVRSTSTIHHHLSALKKKGWIHWNPAEKRAITLNETLLASDPVATAGQLPMMGTIAAGTPLQVYTESQDQLDVTSDLYPPGCYALQVRGESMIEDHIMDGDVVVINPKARVLDGDTVVALVEGETTTLKRIYKEKDGLIRLQPANATLSAMFFNQQDVLVQGKVEAVLRRL